MKYCLRCGNSFSRIDSLKRHLKKEIPCNINYINILREEVIEKYNEYLSTFINSIANTKPIESNNVANSNINISNNVDHTIQYVKKCEYCGKEFSHRNSYYLHKKKYCGILKKENEKISTIKEILDTKYEELKIEFETKLENIKNNEEQTKSILEKEIEDKNKIKEKLEKEIEDKNKIQDELKNKIDELENKIQTLIASSNNNDTNNYNTNIQNQQINFYINGYGNENIDNISTKDWHRILNKKYLALPELIKKIYIDIEENRNIYVPSHKDKYGMIYNGEHWEMRELKYILEELVRDNIDRMYDFINKPSTQVKDELYTKIDEIIDRITNEDTVRQGYKEKIKILLMNNKKIIKEYFEITYNKKLEI